MEPHSSTLAWKIPGMEEPGGLSSMGSRRVRHDWVTSLFTLTHWRRKWQPTPVFFPGESEGWGSLAGCHLWGPHRVRHDWSDTAATATGGNFKSYTTPMWPRLLLNTRMCSLNSVDIKKQPFSGSEMVEIHNRILYAEGKLEVTY